MILNNKFEFRVLIVILSMMSMLGLLASDIYIPGLEQITKNLQTTPHQIQLTIGFYLFGLSLFQLIYGPLSDKYGRKPIMLIGFIVYALASLACAYAVNINQLIIFRLIQALGACAGLVIGRAIIADLFDSVEAPKIYNIIYPIVAASPAIAPLIGGYLITYWGWRSTFVCIFIFASILILLSAFLFKESKAIQYRTDIKVSSIAKNYKTILQEYNFWRYVIPVFTLYGVWFTFLTQASFLYGKMGYKPEEIGYFYFPLAISVYLGNIFCKKFRQILSGEILFIIGLMVFLFGGVAFAVVNSFFSVQHAWQLIIPMSIVSFSNGIILPLGMAFAISLNKSISGSASAMVGFFQIGFSSLCASFFGGWWGISSKAMASEIIVLAIISSCGYFLFRYLHHVNDKNILIEDERA